MRSIIEHIGGVSAGKAPIGEHCLLDSTLLLVPFAIGMRLFEVADICENASVLLFTYSDMLKPPSFSRILDTINCLLHARFKRNG